MCAKTLSVDKYRVNILVVPIKENWCAKVYRKDNAMLIHETGEYRDRQSAYEKASSWAKKNHCLIRNVSGMMPDFPRFSAKDKQLPHPSENGGAS